MATCHHDWQVVELPCVQTNMSLLLSVLIKFDPSCSLSIFSQATPYFPFQFPPLCKRWALTNYRLFFWDDGEGETIREREQRGTKQKKKQLGWEILYCFWSLPKYWKNKSFFTVSSKVLGGVRESEIIFYISMQTVMMLLYRPDGPNYVHTTQFA